MRKFIPILILIFSIALIAQENDGYIDIEFYGDSLTIRHYGAWRNCGARYSMEIELINSTLSLMENDTSSEWMYCMCFFDMAVTIQTPPAGTYSLVIHTTNKFQGDTSLVADTSITINYIPLISYSNPGCMTNSKQETGTEIPLIDHYESDCQSSLNNDLYTYTYNDNVQITWYVDSINIGVTPKWDAFLFNDTLFLSMLDTGAVIDCTCSKYLTAMFGPLPPGKYIVNFLDGELGYPKFIVEEQVVLQVENSELILSWDIAELNCCLETQWDGWLVDNTFHVTMIDTGAPCDCICPFELSARFGPFKPGEYILDFHSTNLGSFNFTIGGTKAKTTLAVLSFYQSECYDAVEVKPKTDIPEEYALLSCYPNPFNPTATITYFLPKQADILLQVIDINGRQIQSLFKGTRDSGTHRIHWNASYCPSGIYIVVLSSQNTTIGKKVLLLK
ncbi:T9SS type A sorting domain-containing protein [bacterium]|nr:T9SS type A sorting domain-containing protein [bacterium]MBU1634708.1 T9SS type A sorting domain-containing protein [bacterium]MBU1874785.1 T9SS type A sorting domain-containing protein [bacterium]